VTSHTRLNSLYYKTCHLCSVVFWKSEDRASKWSPLRGTRCKLRRVRPGGMENGLEVEADRIKYMVLSQDQNASRSHRVKIYNSSCEKVEQVKYLGTTTSYQISIQQEIKIRIKSGNICYQSV